MKRFLSLAMFFALSLPMQAQLNPNGGFEDGTPGAHTGTEVTGWDFQVGGTADAVFEITNEPDFVHSGNQALKVTVNAIGTDAWQPQVFNTDFAIESNTTYVISAWAKTDFEGALAHFTCGSLSPNYKEWGRMGSVALTLEWQQVTFQITTGDPETEPRAGVPIHFGVADNLTLLPVTFYIDDVEATILGATNVENEDIVVQKYSLEQNYPNPFNPATTISFSLSEHSSVRLILVDALGKRVKELAEGSFGPGLHTVVVDASGLASGVYFYRMEAGTFVDTKKLVLIR